MSARVWGLAASALAVVGGAIWGISKLPSGFDFASKPNDHPTPPPPARHPQTLFEMRENLRQEATPSTPGPTTVTLTNDTAANDDGFSQDRALWLGWRDYIVDTFIAADKFTFVDSNIWMKPEYRPALDVLMTEIKNKNTRLFMLGAQLLEIKNLQGKKTASVETRRRATEAMHLIKRYTREHCIKQQEHFGSTDLRAMRDVDSYVIRTFAAKCAEDGRAALFITEDNELLTRLYSSDGDCYDTGKGNLLILEGKQFSTIFDPQFKRGAA